MPATRSLVYTLQANMKRILPRSSTFISYVLWKKHIVVSTLCSYYLPLYVNLFIQNFKDNSDKYKILRSVSDPGFTPVFLRQYSSPKHNTILFFTNEFYYRLWFWISSCYGVLGNSKMNIIPPVIELQTLLVLYRL